MITIVVGAQFGGEGKGKICSYLGLTNNFDFVCRTGGINSSHTVKYQGITHKLRMMPAVAAISQSKWVYGAGSLIHISTLFSECEILKCNPADLLIDYRAGIVTQNYIDAQRADQIYHTIGSTLTGTGYASADRCKRRLPLARDFDELRSFLCDVPSIIHNAAHTKKTILIEGHQGAGLSNYHGDYPFTSSRDCIAASLMAEIGLGPKHEVEVVLALKVFPTRNSAGKLLNEMPLIKAEKLGISEFGGGSWGIPDKRRRVGQLDLNEVRRAVILNTPTYLALTGLDYKFPELRGAKHLDHLSKEAWNYISKIEKVVDVPIGLLSTGADTESTIDLRKHIY